MKCSSMVPPIRPGMKVLTRAIFPHPLPHGLRAGAEVTVLRVADGTCLVCDDAGGEWTVGLVSVDPGELVWAESQWVPGRRA